MPFEFCRGEWFSQDSGRKVSWQVPDFQKIFVWIGQILTREEISRNFSEGNQEGIMAKVVVETL